MTDLHDRVMNLTSRSRDLLRRLDPHPSECPVSDSGEHETYGGICHCGWSRDRPHVAGEAVMPDRQELAVWLADIEAAAAGLPDGELITDAHGDELEHGGPGDFPGQFPDRTETPRETAAREKRDANP